MPHLINSQIRVPLQNERGLYGEHVNFSSNDRSVLMNDFVVTVLFCGPWICFEREPVARLLLLAGNNSKYQGLVHVRWDSVLPIRGTASEVVGIDSATRFRNTVNDRRIVTPANTQGVYNTYSHTTQGVRTRPSKFQSVSI